MRGSHPEFSGRITSFLEGVVSSHLLHLTNKECFETAESLTHCTRRRIKQCRSAPTGQPEGDWNAPTTVALCFVGPRVLGSIGMVGRAELRPYSLISFDSLEPGMRGRQGILSNLSPVNHFTIVGVAVVASARLEFVFNDIEYSLFKLLRTGL